MKLMVVVCGLGLLGGEVGVTVVFRILAVLCFGVCDFEGLGEVLFIYERNVFEVWEV
jgi:hypothetical protein